jgi:hypothetical protein
MRGFEWAETVGLPPALRNENDVREIIEKDRRPFEFKSRFGHAALSENLAVGMRRDWSPQKCGSSGTLLLLRHQ